MSSELIRAAKEGDIQAIKRIIYQGWIYPRMILSQFYNKSHLGIRKTIAEFVGIYGIDLDATDNVGDTALHYASHNGKPDCVEILLRFGANVNAADDNYGLTALHYASYEGKPNCVWILCKMGANINSTNKWGKTALHDASKNCHSRCMKILLGAGADPSIRDREGITALHLASGWNNSERMDILRMY